ncbi:MAG: 50S ribosomal protein L3 N(5)-glutamine methyltransferase, partial [Polaromonas sp.]
MTTTIPAPTVTVLALIEQMADRLDAAGLSFADGYGQGTTNAFDEAAWLVLWKLGLEIDDLESVENRQVAPEDQAQVALLVDQRISTRQPAAYLTNEAWLMGVPFYVDERVIIPRSLIA